MSTGLDTKLNAKISTFDAHVESSEDIPPPETRSNNKFIASGKLEFSKLSENEILYIKINDFTKPIMPRARMYRQSNELAISASRNRYWLITLSGSAEDIVSLDEFLQSECKYVVTQREVKENISLNGSDNQEFNDPIPANNDISNKAENHNKADKPITEPVYSSTYLMQLKKIDLEASIRTQQTELAELDSRLPHPPPHIPNSVHWIPGIQPKLRLQDSPALMAFNAVLQHHK